MNAEIPDFIKRAAFDDETSIEAYKIYKNLSPISKFVHGNRVKVYSNGYDYFKSLCNDVRLAKKRVWMEMYIYDPSPWARELLDHLIAASRRGCDVVLLLDYFGSLEFPDSWLAELKAKGVNVHVFNPVYLLSSSKNHRKLIITDDTAYCGSSNISHKSAGPLVEGEIRFHELGVRVKGPVVAELGKSFISTLELAQVPLKRQPFQPDEYFEDGSMVQILESNPKTRNNTIQKVFKYLLNNAQKSIYVASSYFRPQGFLRRSLINASNREVPMRLLLSGSSDIYFDVNSTLYLAHKLMRQFPNSDSKIFLTKKWHFHGKSLIVDDLWTSIGSFNMDRISSRRNLELNLGILDYRIARQVKDIHTRFSSSEFSNELTREQIDKLPLYMQAYRRVCYSVFKHLSSTKLLDSFIDDGFKTRFKCAFVSTFIEDNVGTMLSSYSNIIGI